MHRNCSSGARGRDSTIYPGPADVLIRETACPPISIILIEEFSPMAPRYEEDVAHILIDVVQEYCQRQGAVVRMGPELDILMPTNLLPSFRRLEIEFAVVEFDVGADQVFHNIDEDGFAHKFPECRMKVRR